MNISLTKQSTGRLSLPPRFKSLSQSPDHDSRSNHDSTKVVSPNIELSEIQRFLSLSLTGSYTETAYRLGISETHLRRQIRSLEKELGFKALEKSNKGRITLTTHGKEWLKSFRSLERSLKSYNTTIQDILLKSNKLNLAIDPALSLTRLLRSIITKSQTENFSERLNISHHRLNCCDTPDNIDAFLTFSPPKNKDFSSRIIARKKLWAYRSKNYASALPLADHTSVLVPPPIIEHCCTSDPSWTGGSANYPKTCIPAPCSSESLQLIRQASYILVSLGLEDDLIPEDVEKYDTEDQTEIDIYLLTQNSNLSKEKELMLNSLFGPEIR